MFFLFDILQATSLPFFHLYFILRFDSRLSFPTTLHQRICVGFRLSTLAIGIFFFFFSILLRHGTGYGQMTSMLPANRASASSLSVIELIPAFRRVSTVHRGLRHRNINHHWLNQQADL